MTQEKKKPVEETAQDNFTEQEVPKMERPLDTLTVKVNGKNQDVFMSSGLLRVLVNYVNELDDVTAVYMNGKVQETCMIEALVKRDDMGKPETPIEELSLFAFTMDPAEGDKLAKWIGDHCLYFFINGAASMSEGIQNQSQTMGQLMQHLAGMNNLAQ